MTLKIQAVSGVKWSGFSMVTVFILQFVTLAILARILSPSDFGLMGMITVVISFAKTFSDMGISNAVIYRQDITSEELSSLYWINIISGILIYIIVCTSVPLLISFYHEPRLENLIYIAALVFLISPFGQQFQILLQKNLQFDHLAIFDILGSIANTITSIILAYLGFGVFSLIWGLITSTSLRVLLLTIWGWNKCRPRFHFSKYDFKGYISFGLYQMGEKAINFINSNLDYLLIGSILGAKALGYYTLAYNMVLKPASMINPVITRVAFPVFSKMQNDTAGLKRIYFKIHKLLSLVNFPIIFGLAVVAPVSVPVLFGPQWHPSIVLVQILSIVALLRSIGNPVGSLLLAKGRADLGFKWNLCLTVTQIPGLYLGAKLGGTFGVAITFALLMVLYSILSYPFLIRKLLGSCLREYIYSMWSSFRSSFIMACIVFSIGIFFRTIPQQINLTIQILIGMLVYIILTLYSEKMITFEMINLFWKKNDWYLKK